MAKTSEKGKIEQQIVLLCHVHFKKNWNAHGQIVQFSVGANGDIFLSQFTPKKKCLHLHPHECVAHIYTQCVYSTKRPYIRSKRATLWHTVTYCDSLWLTVTQCDTLQRTATSWHVQRAVYTQQKSPTSIHGNRALYTWQKNPILCVRSPQKSPVYMAKKTYVLTEEIRLQIFGSPDLSVFLIDLLSDRDSVYSSENLLKILGSPMKACMICTGPPGKTCWIFFWQL